MQKFFDSVVRKNVNDDSLVAVPFAGITVNVHGGGLASIYDINGNPASNPFQADAVGYFEFYAADGRYDVVLSGPDAFSRTVQNVILDDPAQPSAIDPASGIKFTPAGGLSSTDVQAALEELDSEKQGALGYTAENVSHKDASGGYPGLTLFKLNLRNVAGTITSWFTTAATVARTWTLPDKDGTVAMVADITGTNSGTNTGDETAARIAAIDHAAASKATPVDADEFSGTDSASSYSLMRVTFANIKAAVKTYTDTIYQTLANLSTNTSLGTSDTLYSSQKAVKTYVDAGDAATLASANAYSDAIAQGLSIKTSVRLATAAALPANAYLNGSSGVGATITGLSTGVLTVDDQTVNLNDRVLVKNETSQLENGIYKCTTAGAIGVLFILTRVTDNDQTGEFVGAFTFVEDGTNNISAGFVCANTTAPTVGTTAITWTQFSGAGEITAGTGLSKSGNTLSLTVPVAATNGGTNSTAPLNNNRVMISSGSAIVESGSLTASKPMRTDANGLPTTGNTSLTSEVSGTLQAAQAPALTGDVTTSAGSLATTIPVGTVTDAKASLSDKPACRVVATSNLTLSGTQTIDSVAVAAGDLVLATAQSTSSQNGPWVVASGAWARPSWYPAGGTTQAFANAIFPVYAGTANGGSNWRITTTAAITIDTTSVAFAQIAIILSSGALSGTLPAANFPALTGDVTTAGGALATTIANAAVTYAKMQNISATSKVLGRKTAGAGSTEELSLSDVLDLIGSAAQGDILYRGASSWARLAAGTSGYVLQTQGASANPSWAAVSGVTGVTGLSAALAVKTWSGVSTAQAFIHNTDFDFTTSDEYWFQLIAINCTNNTNHIWARPGVGGGPTYDSGGNYDLLSRTNGIDGFSDTATANTDRIYVTDPAYPLQGSGSQATSRGFSGWLRMIMPRDTTANTHKFFHSQFDYMNSNTANFTESRGNHRYKGNIGSALTGLQISNNGGNWAGTARAFAVKNS